MKVCILGAGLSSLTLAKAMVNKKIYVDVISTQKIKNIDQTRTLGISKSNVDYFNSNIIDIENISWNLKKIEIYSDNLQNEKLLNFENNNDHLFSMVRNNELYNLIDASLLKNNFFKKINFYKKNLLDQYDLIINTEYNHAITKKYFNKKIIKKYSSYAFTTIIEHDNIINNVAIQIFTKNGPLAFLPISNFETSVVYSFKHSKINNKENITELIKKYNIKYKIKTIKKINSFELKSLNLRSYYYKNILAFGDLLHRIHPLAGQGFNMTIRDIEVLLNIISDKSKLGLSVDSMVGMEFEKILKHKNLIFSNGIDLIYEFFNFERNMKSNMISKSIQLLGKNPNINKFFKKVADKGIQF